MYLLIALKQPSFEYLFAFTIALNIGLSLCTAIIDGISVQISNHFKAQNNVKTLHSAAGIQSISYFFRSFGSLSSSAMLIGLNRIANYGVIALSGSIYLFIVLPFLCCLFPKIDTLQHRHQKFKICKAEVLAIWKCLCFIFLLNIPPTITDVFYSFIYSRTYLEDETLRIFKFMSLIGAVLGALFFFIVCAKKCENMRCLVLIFVLMQILNSLVYLSVIPLTNLSNRFVSDSSLTKIYGIPFVYFISAILMLSAYSSSLMLQPQLTLAAKMSPHRLETAAFSIFIGVSHLGELVSSSISSILLNVLNVKESHWNNLTKYVVICSVLGLLPLCGLVLLKGIHNDEMDNDTKGDEYDQMLLSDRDNDNSKRIQIG